MKKCHVVLNSKGMTLKSTPVRALCATALVCITPFSGFAEGNEADIYSGVLLACLEAGKTSEARRNCKGVMATACMDGEEAGYSTYGMVRCTSAETQMWDQFLNVTYQIKIQRMQEMDTTEAEHFPDFANRAESLRAAQRAWIVFRDGECGLAYALWGSGSMRQIAGASCVMEMTADRAIDLELLGEEMQ